MPFPASRRVVYDKNPLAEVICQLKFPTVLLIEAELPATFQDKLRGDYPVFEDGTRVGIPEVLPHEIARLLGPQFGFPTPRVYEFASSDALWKAHLNRDFVALSCFRYSMWDDFRARLLRILECLDAIYGPSFYTRVGLRYRNIIDRGRLGLEGVPWGQLFQPHLAAELSSNMADSIVQNQHQLLINLPNEEGQVRVVHGLTGASPQTYAIDSDFFTEQRVEKTDAARKLDAFNKYSGGLFRSLINDKLDGAMGPHAV